MEDNFKKFVEHADIVIAENAEALRLQREADYKKSPEYLRELYKPPKLYIRILGLPIWILLVIGCFVYVVVVQRLSPKELYERFSGSWSDYFRR